MACACIPQRPPKNTKMKIAAIIFGVICLGLAIWSDLISNYFLGAKFGLFSTVAFAVTGVFALALAKETD